MIESSVWLVNQPSEVLAWGGGIFLIGISPQLLYTLGPKCQHCLSHAQQTQGPPCGSPCRSLPWLYSCSLCNVCAGGGVDLAISLHWSDWIVHISTPANTWETLNLVPRSQPAVFPGQPCPLLIRTRAELIPPGVQLFACAVTIWGLWRSSRNPAEA